MDQIVAYIGETTSRREASDYEITPDKEELEEAAERIRDAL
jgi:hypothetical protein